MITGEWSQEPGNIITSYRVGEQEGTKVMEEIKGNQRQIEGEKGKGLIM